MKKINSILALAALVGAMTFTSCTKDETTPGSGVTITRKTPTSSAVLIGTGGKMVVEYQLSADKNLKSLKATKNGTAIQLNGKNEITFSDNTGSYKDTLDITGSVGSTEIYIFTVTDKSDNTASDTITVGVLDAEVALSEKTNGEVFNLQGSGKGAFDLKAGVAKSSGDADADKDIVDQSTVSPTGVVFPKTWGTKNAALFVKASSSFNYTNATNNSAYVEFAKGSSSSSTAALAVGDVYIVKNTRFTNGYVVVKITEVNETSSDNLDNIKFTYKN